MLCLAYELIHLFFKIACVFSVHGVFSVHVWMCADNLGQDALGKEIFNLNVLSFLVK